MRVRSTRFQKPFAKPSSDANLASSASASALAAPACEVASYIAQLSAEMSGMAAAAKLEVLAYLLAMARVEAEMIVRRDCSE